MSEKQMSQISYTQNSVKDDEKADAPTLVSITPKPAITSSTPPNQNENLFPWLEISQDKPSAKTVLSRFPFAGAIGLIGSALTIVLSALVLHFFDGRPVVTGHMPKPAAWLSVILSLNSILVHNAVTQGRAGEFVIPRSS
jgi:hypothetical protein